MDNREEKAQFVGRQIVEHNDLISSVAKMDKVPMKMFELAVSHINVHEPPKDNVVHISKKEMFSFFAVNDSNRNTRFKNSISRMQDQAYFEIREMRGKGYKYRRIVPIPYIEWNDYDDDVIVRFDQAIMPYLIDLRKNFTQYALIDVMELNSKYAVVLYRWLNMKYTQYEYYRDHGGRTKAQLAKLKNPEISLEELRALTDTKEEYQRMSHFTKWILQVPCDEISEHTHLKVTFEKIKSGRRVTGIRFKVTGRPVARLTKKNGEEGQQKQKDARKADSELYANAMASQYTKLLSEHFILGMDDVTNQKTMLFLARHVYPLYDQIIQLKGGGTVGKHYLEDHLRYVAKRYTPNSDKRKRNIGRYLEVAADGYLKRIRN